MDGPAFRPVSAIPLGGRPPDGPGDQASGDTARARHAIVLRRRVAGIVAIGGSLLVILGTALPWSTVVLVDGRQIDRTGWSDPLAPLRWGPVLAVLGFVMILVLTPVVAVESDADEPSGSQLVGRLAVVVAALSTIAVLVAAVALVGASDGPNGSSVSVEFGPFLVLSGALLALVGAVLAAVARPPAMVTPPRAVGAVG